MSKPKLKEICPHWDYIKRKYIADLAAHDELYGETLKILRPLMQKWCDKHYSMTDVAVVMDEASCHLRNEMTCKRDHPEWCKRAAPLTGK